MRALAGLLLPMLVTSAPAGAFAVLVEDFGVRATLERAARWDADPLAAVNLADGIQVAIEPGFVAAFGITDAGGPAAVEAGILASFAAWENGALAFDVAFDGPVADGRGVGAEMDLFVLPGDDPRLCGSIAGCTWWEFDWSDTRRLTNGQVEPGWALQGVDIYIHQQTFTTLFALSGLSGALPILQRTLIHEVGHGIGLHHPTDPGIGNFDTDFDPLNEMPVDPLDPASGFLYSPFVDCTSIMTDNAGLCDPAAVIATSLLPDDRGGRNVLYPFVPEPPGIALLALAAAGLGRRARTGYTR